MVEFADFDLYRFVSRRLTLRGVKLAELTPCVDESQAMSNCLGGKFRVNLDWCTILATISSSSTTKKKIKSYRVGWWQVVMEPARLRCHNVAMDSKLHGSSTYNHIGSKRGLPETMIWSVIGPTKWLRQLTWLLLWTRLLQG